MTLRNVGRWIWPSQILQGGPLSSALTSVTVAFDSATDRIAWVGRSPISDSIASIHFRLGSVTTGCTVQVRIETVVNGRPSGTLWATDTSASVVIADTDDNTWKTATLTAAAALTPDDEFAIVIIVTSGTPNLQFRTPPNNGGFSAPVIAHYPLTLHDTGGGTWGAQSAGWEMIVQYQTAGVVPMIGLDPTTASGTVQAFNSGTSPNERALRFQKPVRCRVKGLRVFLFNIAAGADLTFSLWDATGDADVEALGQATLDGDFALTTTQDGPVDLFFASPVTIEADTTYYAGVRADTANNIGTGEVANSAVANALLAYDGVNAEMYLATRTWTAGAAGAWTDTTTTLPLIHLIIDQAEDGVSAGGASAIANLRGNFQ
jgi:hypothetical protein